MKLKDEISQIESLNQEIRRLTDERDKLIRIVRARRLEDGFERVNEAVSALYHTSINLLSKSRDRSLIDVRRMCYVYLKSQGNQICSIQRKFRRTHATIISALNNHEPLLKTNAAYRKEFEKFMSVIKSLEEEVKPNEAETV